MESHIPLVTSIICSHSQYKLILIISCNLLYYILTLCNKQCMGTLCMNVMCLYHIWKSNSALLSLNYVSHKCVKRIVCGTTCT